MGILNSILRKAGLGEIPKEMDGKMNTPPSAVPLANLSQGNFNGEGNSNGLTGNGEFEFSSLRSDIAAQLDQLANEHEDNLNWRESIVDLLELLGLHSDVDTRRSLAAELGASEEITANTARMDAWLHEIVLRRIAQSGGSVPPELFH